MLEPEQEELLATLFAAWKVDRSEFHTLAGDDEVRAYHRGLANNGVVINLFDIESLADIGLIRITRRSSYGEVSFGMTKAGLELIERSVQDHSVPVDHNSRATDPSGSREPTLQEESLLSILVEAWEKVSRDQQVLPFQLREAGNTFGTLVHPGLPEDGRSVLLAQLFGLEKSGRVVFERNHRFPAMGPVGFVWLTPKARNQRVAVAPAQRSNTQIASTDYVYDVAISFAGPQRDMAEQLAVRIRDEGFRVFYDDFEPENLWGEDLGELLDRVYRVESRYCVIFVSQDYRDRMWTIHERRSAVARMVTEKGRAYILPVAVTPVDLPGIPPTIAYLSLESRTIEQVAEILIKKLRANVS